MRHSQGAAIGSPAQYDPACPSKDHGLNISRALDGVGIPGEANWTIRGCWCPWDPGSGMGMWMWEMEWRYGMEMRDAGMGWR